MINVTDLRIGNLVKLFQGIGDNGPEYREFIINGIMSRHQSQHYLLKDTWIEASNNLEPISLTKELLIELGFKPFCKDFALNGIIIHTRKRGFVLKKSVPDIKYVHQLQNLFYILCGKELEINKK